MSLLYPLVRDVSRDVSCYIFRCTGCVRPYIDNITVFELDNCIFLSCLQQVLLQNTSFSGVPCIKEDIFYRLSGVPGQIVNIMLINRHTRTNCSNIQLIIRRTGNYFVIIVVFAVNYCNLRVFDCHAVLLKH